MQSTKISIATPKFPAIAVTVAGQGKTALLLIHGFPATGSLWNKIVPQLAAQFTVVIPDLPGVGDSLLGTDTIAITDLAEGMLALLDGLEISNIVVAGHSMGGYIALAMASLAPDRILGLSLIHSTAKPDDEEKKKTRQKAIKLIKDGGKVPFIQTSVKSLFSDTFKEAHIEIIDRQIAESEQVPDETLVAFYNAMMERPDRIDILQMAVYPVQWVIGSKDAVIPKDTVVAQSTIARINFVSIYPDCGHMSMLEDPETLAKDLAAFTVYCSKRN